MTVALSNSQIEARYRAMTTRSATLHTEAKKALPSGVVHDSRHVDPHPLYCELALGPRKWDVDGNGYVDYYGGHGALLLGHSHPEVMAKAAAQLQRGTHFAACSELEIRWSRLIQEMVPSAERVRFTASGTEASHMAMRLARAATGRSKIVRFTGHFHGWQDHVAFGVRTHLDGTPTPGVVKGVADSVVLIPANDLKRLEAVLSTDRDIAAVMVEGIGSFTGSIPTSGPTLKAIRALTQAHNVLMIWDEVVTGFRVSPGGAQAHYGIKPDLTLLAKVLAGGLPGGAVVGRRDILEWLDFEASEKAGREKIAHQGTFNANPVSAAAGIAALEIIKNTDACARANAAAARLRAALNAVLEEEKVPWAVFGEFSIFHIFTNPDGRSLTPTRFDASALDTADFKPDPRKSLLSKLYLAMVTNGVDLMQWRGGFVSATHGPAEEQETIAAWRKALRLLKDEGEL